MSILHTGAVIKSVEDSSKRIIYAKISDSVLDRDGEIIRLSAWSENQLNDFLKQSGALLLSHRYQDLPIGRIRKFDRISDGLYMQAQLVKGTEAADEAWKVIQQIGQIGFSVGFQPKSSENISVSNLEKKEQDSCIQAGLSLNDMVKVYLSVELLEVSLVSVPSLSTATLISYKSGKLKNGFLKKACEEIEIVDDNFGFEKFETEDLGDKIRVKIKFSDKQFQPFVDRAIANLKARVDRPPKPKNPGDEEIEVPSKEEIDKMVVESLEKAIREVINPENIKKAIQLAADKLAGKVY